MKFKDLLEVSDDKIKEMNKRTPVLFKKLFKIKKVKFKKQKDATSHDEKVVLDIIYDGNPLKLMLFSDEAHWRVINTKINSKDRYQIKDDMSPEEIEKIIKKVI